MIGADVVAVMVLGSVVTWWGLFHGLPRLTRSRFRYELWRIRDNMVDLVLTGVIPDGKIPRRYIAAIEFMIAHPERITPLRTVLLPRKPGVKEEFLRGLQEFRQSLNPDAREKFDECDRAMSVAFRAKQIAASLSPFMWPLSIMFILLFVTVSLMQRWMRTNDRRFPSFAERLDLRRAGLFEVAERCPSTNLAACL